MTSKCNAADYCNASLSNVYLVAMTDHTKYPTDFMILYPENGIKIKLRARYISRRYAIFGGLILVGVVSSVLAYLFAVAGGGVWFAPLFLAFGGTVKLLQTIMKHARNREIWFNDSKKTVYVNEDILCDFKDVEDFVMIESGSALIGTYYEVQMNYQGANFRTSYVFEKTKNKEQALEMLNAISTMTQRPKKHAVE